MRPKAFHFASYRYKPATKSVDFHYKIEFFDHAPLAFKETIILPVRPLLKGAKKEIFDNLLRSLHLILGISYYKTYCPPKIELQKPLSKKEAEFWNKVYEKGLGEFFYRNKIDPAGLIKFPFSDKVRPPSPQTLRNKNRALVGVGGGKDSIVALEVLKQQKFDSTAFVVETQVEQPIITNVIKRSGLPSIAIRRVLDQKLIDGPQAFRGHVPISAVYAFLGSLTALLCDYSYIVVGNEHSSNFGNLNYRGRSINHQWSKSAEFEQLFQEYMASFITPSITYFSLLRPFFEIRVVEMFAKVGGAYFDVFSSCNRSFRIAKKGSGPLWCGECAKCVFVFTLLAAFLPPKKLFSIFKKNLFQDAALLPMFADVLGFGSQKPFDCVGTFEEVQAALYLARKGHKNSLALKVFLPKIKGAEQLVKSVFLANRALMVPTQFRFLGMENALILGYGKEGRAAHAYLSRKYPKLKIGIADQKDSARYLEKQADHDIVVRSPGIPKRLVSQQYVTPTNIFFSQVRDHLTIGVTGSKGKSTTTALIHAMLRAGGIQARLLGNIGYPAIEALARPLGKKEVFVVELSSYQLDDIEFSPNIAVVTALFPEHMTYHGGLDHYYRAKKNIIEFQNEDDIFVYDPSSKMAAAWAAEAGSRAVRFARTLPPRGRTAQGVEIPLLGEHNLENIKAAATVAKLLKVPDAKIWEAIKKFRGLPHRLERVGKFGGITFYDDAISTAPESTIAAIKALAPKYCIGTILLGGEDRGYDFAHLEKEIRKAKIRNIVLFPTSGSRIIRSKKDLNILKTRSMEAAVKFAYVVTPPGSVCLLSTASPSYSLWQGFEKKGDLFQSLVKKYSP